MHVSVRFWYLDLDLFTRRRHSVWLPCRRPVCSTMKARSRRTAYTGARSMGRTSA